MLREFTEQALLTICQFRSARYLLTTQRPPEEETVKQFLNLMKPLIENFASVLHKTVTWEEPKVAVSEAQFAHMRFIDAIHPAQAGMSNSRIHFSLHGNEGIPPTKLGLAISNFPERFALAFYKQFSPDQDECPIEGVGSIDYNLRLKGFKAEMMQSTWTGLGATLMNEKDRAVAYENLQRTGQFVIRLRPDNHTIA